jgi:hypothetical protein
MTNFKEFKQRTSHGGIQYLAFFPNLYGVSIVKNDHSYGGTEGLWELAVLEGDEDEWELTYDTPITDNVLGYLTEDEVNEIVDKVIAL